MKRWNLYLLVVLSTILFAVGMMPQAQVGVVTSSQSRLSIRSGPGTEYRRITVIVPGTNVALDGRDHSALWARGITQDGTVGWMAARYLSVGTDAIFALPVIDVNAPISVSAPGGGASSQPAAAPQEQAAGGSGMVVSATVNVNIRRGPGTTYGRIGLLHGGTQFNLDGRNNAASWVRGINGDGTVGWVSAAYVRGGVISSLPVVDVNTPFGLAAPGGGASSEPQTASAVSAPPPITSTAPITGFSYGGHVRGLDEGAANYMRIAGMTWAKLQIRYNQGDDAGGIAYLIDDAHAKGFRILLGVVGHVHQVNNGGYFESYAAYVGGLAAHGADAIEIWNEPNLDREWPAGQIDPARYTQLLAQSYNSIKANNSNTLVISGAMAPTGAEAAFPGRVMNDDRYLSGMVAAGALNYMDCVGAHYNEGIVPPTQNSGDPRGDSYYTRFYNGMVNTYSSIAGGKPLCFTELGYLSPEGYPPLPGHFGWASNVTVAQQAAWLDQVMSMARNSGRVRLVIIWNINIMDYGADPMGGYAIIRPDGGCPACYALGN